MARVIPTDAPAYALFSGGHDSLCATHYAMENGLAQGVIHVNTGIGVEATRLFVRETCYDFDWPLHELFPPVSYDDLVMKWGFPGPAFHSFYYRRLKERCLAAFARERKERRGDPIVYVTGIRTQESWRRMKTSTEEWKHAPKLGWWWRAPILDWTKADVNSYIDGENLRRNEVVDLLHMSGECLCGCFARPGERDEIRRWFPDTDARISELEQRVAAAGHHGCYWGYAPPAVHAGQLAIIPPGPLCQDCRPAS